MTPLRSTLAPLLVLTAACSTNYAPHQGPRLSVVMSGGSPAYHRDGRTYPHGFAGSGLVDAVADDPEAREAAETFHERQIGGLVGIIGGLICGIGGTALVVSNEDFENDEQSALAAGALVCLMGGTIAGAILIMTAQPYQWDAINIYNDHVDQRLHMQRCSPYYCPPGWVSPYAPVPAPPPPPPASTP